MNGNTTLIDPESVRPGMRPLLHGRVRRHHGGERARRRTPRPFRGRRRPRRIDPEGVRVHLDGDDRFDGVVAMNEFAGGLFPVDGDAIIPYAVIPSTTSPASKPSAADRAHGPATPSSGRGRRQPREKTPQRRRNGPMATTRGAPTGKPGVWAGRAACTDPPADCRNPHDPARTTHP